MPETINFLQQEQIISYLKIQNIPLVLVHDEFSIYRAHKLEFIVYHTGILVIIKPFQYVRNTPLCFQGRVVSIRFLEALIKAVS